LLARESLIALDLEILVLLLIVAFYLNADIVTWFSILSFIVWALRENGDWWYSVGNWVDIWYF